MNFTRYWNIVIYRTLAGIKAESRQNYLGYVWYLLEPVLSTVVIYLALSKVMGKGGPGYIMYLLVGLTTWQWYEGSCLQAGGSIKAKLHILMHFDLPKYLFPLVTVLINSWKFCCIFVVLIFSAYFFGFHPDRNYCYLPVVLACELLLILSIAIPLAVAATYFNDTMMVATSSFRILFYMSGIFFDPKNVPASLRTAFYANPMAGIIESSRNIMIYHEPPNWPILLQGVLQDSIVLALGLWLSHYVNRRILKHATV